MNKTPTILTTCFGFVIAGCGGASFTRTDPTFKNIAGKPTPQLYEKEPPPRSFRAVGLVTIEASQSTPFTELQPALIAKGAAGRLRRAGRGERRQETGGRYDARRHEASAGPW